MLLDSYFQSVVIVVIVCLPGNIVTVILRERALEAAAVPQKG